MKLKKCFKIKKILSTYMITPVGIEGSSVKGIIRLNKAGYDIWQWIDEGLELEEIYSKYAAKYGMSEKEAKNATDALVRQLRETGVFESEIDWKHENLKDL